MKEKSPNKKRLLLFRFLLGQLPLLALLILFMINHYLSLQMLWYITVGICLLMTFISNYYFITELKKVEMNRGEKHQRYFQQYCFIALFLVVGIVSLYRGLTAEHMYQQVIGFIGLTIALIFLCLLLWGLRYMKK
ncbi:TPA: hypothetical protein TZ820_000773 [Streptococcus suis]|nr:hypothetical protein [Streptococcus suis]